MASVARYDVFSPAIPLPAAIRAESLSHPRIRLLSGYTFESLLSCIEEGIIFVDFDARTKHNHGTKFTIKQGQL
ncbi:MAG TPA: MvaI/BcnI family restriction endonuclease [Anaerolineae bacterium]